MSPQFSTGVSYNVSQWRDFFVGHGPVCFKWVTQYCKSPIANVISSVEKNDNVPAGPLMTHKCNICDKSFMSVQQLSLHEFRVHGLKDQIYLCVPETHCTVCLREFHTRERILNHVKYRSYTCRYNLLIRGPVLSQDEADALDNAATSNNIKLQLSGFRRHYVSSPSFRLQGPLAPIILPSGEYSHHHPLGRGHNQL